MRVPKGRLIRATAFVASALIGICAGAFLAVVDEIETFVKKRPSVHRIR
jgi:hypothetical protein